MALTFYRNYEDYRINGEVYLGFLRNVLPELLRGNPVNLRNMWRQQDGAPPHNTRAVRECLNGYFGRQWIGLAGPRAWPPRSPDLTPLDFYLWGTLKNICYKEPPPDRENMIEIIRNACAAIREEELVQTRISMRRRLQCVVEKEGGHIEPFL